MKQLIREHRGKHIWLLAAAGGLLLFLLLRPNRALMTWLVDHVTQPFKQALGALTYLVPIPLAELLYIAMALGLIEYIVRSALLLRRENGRRPQTAYLRLVGLLCAALTVLDWFCLAWGINYYADGFQERSGIAAQETISSGSSSSILSAQSAAICALSPASTPVAREQKSRASQAVILRSGEKVVLLVPFTTPWVARYSTSSLAQCPVMSVKETAPAGTARREIIRIKDSAKAANRFPLILCTSI